MTESLLSFAGKQNEKGLREHRVPEDGEPDDQTKNRLNQQPKCEDRIHVFRLVPIEFFLWSCGKK